MTTHPQPLAFFKCLADASRLRIVGLLANRPHSVEELAEVLAVRPSTVSHHLTRLTAVGLVSAAVQGHYHVYSLQEDALQKGAQVLLQPKGLGSPGLSDEAIDPYERKVLATFLDDEGRLKAHPMKRKKFQVILRHAMRTWFTDAGPWDEREVNNRLRALTDDVASIRRGFIDYRMMTRDARGTAYARSDSATA